MRIDLPVGMEPMWAPRLINAPMVAGEALNLDICLRTSTAHGKRKRYALSVHVSFKTQLKNQLNKPLSKHIPLACKMISLFANSPLIIKMVRTHSSGFTRNPESIKGWRVCKSAGLRKPAQCRLRQSCLSPLSAVRRAGSEICLPSPRSTHRLG